MYGSDDRSRQGSRGREDRRGRRSFRVGFALLVVCLLVAVALRTHWLPIGWFRPAPEITELHPVVAENRDKLIAESRSAGIDIIITSDFRSSQEQNALYRQGRSDKGAIVTQVKGGRSYHNYGLAIDFALLNPEGKAIWDTEIDGNKNGKSDWMEVVGIAKKLGFEWGGDWKAFKDYPHLQMDFSYSIRELAWGWRPPTQE
jgi:peptidoglycan L-alanyl-D-glutamate endopeptidase CwlK